MKKPRAVARRPQIVAIGLAKPVPEVVEQAESILRHAKDGTLRTLSWVGDCTDHIKTGITPGVDTFATVGHLERLKHRLMVGADDRSVRDDD